MLDFNAQLVVVEDSSVDEGLVVALEQRCIELLQRLSLSAESVAVSLVSLERMRALNRDYHALDAPTDVLSFPYKDPASQVSQELFVEVAEAQGFLGDIALCTTIAAKQAEQKGIQLIDELAFLFAHGLEHLQGHHHE